VDEVVATLFAGPHSYTGEDVVEIAAHGSPELLREILQSAMRAGARLAEPGEFTLRAFLNGRLDLAQAEAVNDLVEAVTPLQARVAFDQLQGTLTEAIGRLDRELFDLCVRLEASLDFPDEGYHFADRADAVAGISRVRDGIAALLETARQGRVVREGRQIAILGKPNVGKSTLFNRLVGADRAIVTDIPGTTRDLLTETVGFEGIKLGVVDTAGIRAGADIIEAEGVARARRAAEVADVVVLVFDQSRPLEHRDQELLAETRDKPRVLVINKADLEPRWSLSELMSGRASAETARSANAPYRRRHGRAGSACRAEAREGEGGPSRPAAESAGSRPDLLRPVSGSSQAGEPQASVLSGTRVPGPGSRVPTAPELVPVSLKTGGGWPAFRAALLRALDAGEPLRDTPLVTNVRHQALLEQALAALEKADTSLSEEFLLADLAVARQAFEEITGKRTSEDVLQAIFSRFCIGK
jgi:tRNA modification GTPase